MAREGVRFINFFLKCHSVNLFLNVAVCHCSFNYLVKVYTPKSSIFYFKLLMEVRDKINHCNFHLRILRILIFYLNLCFVSHILLWYL